MPSFLARAHFFLSAARFALPLASLVVSHRLLAWFPMVFPSRSTISSSTISLRIAWEYGASGSYVILCPDAGELALVPDSAQWFSWLASLSSFRFVGQSGRFTAGRASKQHRPTRSWRAVHSFHNHNYKYHLGVTEHLTLARLEQAAAALQAHMTSL